MKGIKKVNMSNKTRVKFRRFNPKRPPNKANKPTPFNKKYGNNKRITGKQLLKNIRCHTCKQKGHMSRNCPENQHAHRKESRPTRHKAQIAPNTALYEILELDKEGAEEAFVMESELPLPIANVQFVGMTIISELNLNEERRQILQKITRLFAG